MKIISILIILLSLMSCKKEEEVLMSPLTKDSITGKVLWNRILNESNYLNYSYWPGHEGIQPGQSPHASLHRIFVNRPLLAGLPTSNKEVPNGSIIVKENLLTDESLDALTVMVKVDGYNIDGGDWFWAKFSKDGKVLAEGVPGGCVSCHSGMKNNDYIIIKPIDEGLNIAN